jgi:hypothetical protein
MYMCASFFMRCDCTKSKKELLDYENLATED